MLFGVSFPSFELNRLPRLFASFEDAAEGKFLSSANSTKQLCGLDYQFRSQCLNGICMK